MKTTLAVFVTVGLALLMAAPAQADAQPSARDIQAAVDSYLASSDQDANLVGGPGSAGYDQGFWIKGGDFSLKINLTLQARYEAFMYDKAVKANALPGGSLSGFSLPRATLKFSGTAPCSISYYMELEFGHYGEDALQQQGGVGPVNAPLGPLTQSLNLDNTREAWIQWSASDMFNVRMGQIRTATTRQMMIAPELQQFVDVSLASAFTGWIMPGYTDRNRDHGMAFHGAFGCNNEWSYLATITNGDGGDSIRNVVDGRTSDNLAFSGRLNWAFAKPIGYSEGALNNQTCEWHGEVGAWAYYYADRVDRAHLTVTDAMRYGVDLALAWGGWTFTGSATFGSDENAAGSKVDYSAYMAQFGFHFTGTAFEIVSRWSYYKTDNPGNAFVYPQQPLGDGGVGEFAFGLNYYLNGHGNKLSLDASWVFGGTDPTGAAGGSRLIFDPYTGYPGANAANGDNTYGVLIRFQWQLAL
jgi:hypothetical protein